MVESMGFERISTIIRELIFIGDITAFSFETRTKMFATTDWSVNIIQIGPLMFLSMAILELLCNTQNPYI